MEHYSTKLKIFIQENSVWVEGKYLIESENPIDMLACNVLGHSHFSHVFIASNNLRGIAPQLIVTKRPKAQLKLAN